MSVDVNHEFEVMFSKKPEFEFFAPGRVNLIGEHIDYNGGHVFPCALTFGTRALAAKRNDKEIHFYSMNFPEAGILPFELDSLHYDSKDAWTNYPKGVIKMIQEHGRHIHEGLDVLYYGDIPNGSGLSSSASIEVVTAWMINEIFNLGLTKIECVQLSQKAENEFVGVNSGIMDQFASGMGKEDHAILLNTSTLDYQYVPFKLDNISLVIMNTNKRRDLIESAYNTRRMECDEGLAIVQKYYDVQTLCDLELSQLQTIEDKFESSIIYRRVKHAVSENERTLQAVSVLQANDIEAFGRLMNESHASLKNDYEVTGIELDTLVETAQKIEGTLGSRVTGAGFGGCAIALVRDEAIESFKAKVRTVYLEKVGYEPTFYSASAGEGVHQVR